MLLLDKLVLAGYDPFIMLLLLGSRLVLLFLVLLEVVLGNGDDLDGLLADFLLGEGGRGRDIGDIFRVLNVEQLVVFLDQLVRLEGAELEVSKQCLVLIVLLVVIEDTIRLLIASTPVAITVAAPDFT